MSKSLVPMLIVVFLAGGVFSLIGLRNAVVDRSISDHLENLSAFELTNNPKILEELSASSSSILPSQSIHSKIATKAMQAAAKVRTFDEQRKFYCTALVEYEKAIQANPRRATYLIAWANVRQILGDADCLGSIGPKEYHPAVKQAVEFEPLNADVLYSAGLISLWNKEKEAAMLYFKRMLEVSLSVPAERWAVIASLIEQPGDITKLVPATFPQIGSWSKFLLRSGSTNLTLPMLKELGDLQKTALKELNSKIEQYGIPIEVYERYLYDLVDSSAEDQIRRSIDARLLEFIPKQDLARHSFLKARVNTHGLRIVRSYLLNDSRYENGIFLNWAGDDNVYLDNFHTSFGFFLADDQSVKLIELRSKKQPSRGVTKLIKVLVSNDNQKWTEIEVNIGESIRMLDYWTIPIELNGESYQYFKIHFNSSSKIQTFVNRLDMGLHAYGNTARIE